MSQQQVDAVVCRNRELFEDLTGISFAQQQQFREALQQVVTTGDETVATLLHSFSDALRNGSGAFAAASPVPSLDSSSD